MNEPVSQKNRLHWWVVFVGILSFSLFVQQTFSVRRGLGGKRWDGFGPCPLGAQCANEQGNSHNGILVDWGGGVCGKQSKYRTGRSSKDTGRRLLSPHTFTLAQHPSPAQ